MGRGLGFVDGLHSVRSRDFAGVAVSVSYDLCENYKWGFGSGFESGCLDPFPFPRAFVENAVVNHAGCRFWGRFRLADIITFEKPNDSKISLTPTTSLGHI